MLIRRVVPAIIATLAVYAGLAFATAGLLREHYLTPLVTSNPNVPGMHPATVLTCRRFITPRDYKMAGPLTP